MLRIFLTGDNHIGLKYANHPEAETLIRKRIEAFGPMVEKANAEKCDLFVIAGDLFDRTTGIGRKAIREILEHLSAFEGTVVVLPGNHDYYDDDAKVWQDFRAEMEGKENILLLTSYEPRTVPVGDGEAVLYPAFCTARNSRPGENNLGWIKKQNIIPDGRYHIGLAHGAIEGETPDTDKIYFLMTRKELEDIPVDVWLIGHTHVPVPGNLTEDFMEAGKIFNAGTHVQGNVNENTEGLCFIIEIGDDKKVRAKKTVTGNVRFHRIPVRVTPGNMQEELQRCTGRLDRESVVDLVISGAVTDQEYRDRNTVIRGVLDGFLEGTFTDNELSRLITEDLIDAEYPETSAAAGLLKSLLDNPREAQLAYDLLKEIKGGR